MTISPLREVRESYLVVMIDYGFDAAGRRKGREAIVDPEITRREVISRIRSGEYPRDRISFIHAIENGEVSDIKTDILAECEAADYSHALKSAMDFIEVALTGQNAIDAQRDHARGLREDARASTFTKLLNPSLDDMRELIRENGNA